MNQRRILKGWTRVENFDLGDGERRTYEYHVVADDANDRVTLTIRVFREQEQSIRLDPTDFDAGSDQPCFATFAERRVRHLYASGLI